MSTRSTMYKKSVWRTRDSPGWLSIRVAYSSSLKYSSRAPMSSVNLSKRWDQVSAHSSQKAWYPFLKQPHTHPSSFSHLPQHPAIPQASPRPLYQPRQSSPQANHTSLDSATLATCARKCDSWLCATERSMSANQS